jgi:fatty-acyl-CoA synthase
VKEAACWIELHKGETATPEEIIGFCKDKIAHFNIPKNIRFVETFPMTVTDKVQKFTMREEMPKLLGK